MVGFRQGWNSIAIDDQSFLGNKTGKSSKKSTQYTQLREELNSGLLQTFEKATNVYSVDKDKKMEIKSIFDEIANAFKGDKPALKIVINSNATASALKCFIQQIEKDTNIDIWKHVASKKYQIASLEDSDRQTTLNNLVVLGFVQTQGKLEETIRNIKSSCFMSNPHF